MMMLCMCVCIDELMMLKRMSQARSSSPLFILFAGEDGVGVVMHTHM